MLPLVTSLMEFGDWTISMSRNIPSTMSFGIFTERLKAENGKWEAEIEWRKKRDVSWASSDGRTTGRRRKREIEGDQSTKRARWSEGVGRCLLTRHVSVVSRARSKTGLASANPRIGPFNARRVSRL